MSADDRLGKVSKSARVDMAVVLDRTDTHTSGWWRPVRGATPTTAIASAPVRRDGGLAFGATLAFTVILVIAPQTWIPALGELRVALVAALVALGAWALEPRVPASRVAWANREMALAGALLGWAIVTIPLSLWPGGSVAVLTGVYAKALALFWLIANVVSTGWRVERVAWLLSVLGVVPAVAAIMNYVGGVFMSGGESLARIAGYDAPLTGNPNDLALFLDMMLPLTVALAAGARRPIVRFALLVIVALDVCAVVLTLSRAGFLVLLVVAIGVAVRLLPRAGGQAVGAVVLVVVLVVFVAPAGYSNRLASITDIDADPTGSARQRWDDTVAAAELMLAHPIVGVGLGSGTLAMNEARGESWIAVHNVYLQYGVDLGVPGLALFVALLAGTIGAARTARRDAARAGRADLQRLAAGVEISLFAFVAAGLFYPVAYNSYFYYMAGLALAARHVVRREAREAKRS